MDPYHLQDGLGNCMPMIQLPSQRYGESKRDYGVCTTENYLKIFDLYAMCGFPQSAGISHMGFYDWCLPTAWAFDQCMLEALKLVYIGSAVLSCKVMDIRAGAVRWRKCRACLILRQHI